MTEDIRWQNVCGRIGKYEQTAEELEMNVRANQMELVIEVRFDGLCLVSRMFIEHDTFNDALGPALVKMCLNQMVEKIDEGFLEKGIEPYDIRSHA